MSTSTHHLTSSHLISIRLGTLLGFWILLFFPTVKAQQGSDRDLENYLSAPSLNILHALPQANSVSDSLKSPLQALKDSTSCDHSITKSIESLSSKLSRGEHDELLFIKGAALEKCGDFTGAAKAYEQSLRLRRASYALLRLGITKLRSGNLDSAKSLIEEAEWSGEIKKSSTAYLQAIIALKKNDFEGALTLFEYALRQDPKLSHAASGAYSMAEKLSEKTQDPIKKSLYQQKASTYLVKKYSFNSKDKHIALQYMDYLLKTGDLFLRPSLLKEGVSISKEWLDSPDIKSKAELFHAQFLHKLKKNHEAIKFIEGVQSSGGGSPALSDFLTYLGTLP